MQVKTSMRGDTITRDHETSVVISCMYWYYQMNFRIGVIQSLLNVNEVVSFNFNRF